MEKLLIQMPSPGLSHIFKKDLLADHPDIGCPASDYSRKTSLTGNVVLFRSFCRNISLQLALDIQLDEEFLVMKRNIHRVLMFVMARESASI